MTVTMLLAVEGCLSEGLFRIDKILGGGAQAVVCLAHHKSKGRSHSVVLKVVRREHLNNIEVLDRMRDEGRILSRLRHPNILRVFRVLDYDGQPVIEMEFIDGVSLEKLVNNPSKTLPIGIALTIVRDVAIALDVAYNGSFDVDGKPMNIIHRDLKPENIVIDVHGNVKIVDFGVAKGTFTDRQAKSLYLAPGSQGYVSPERFEGRKDSPGVDVYALGVTLFQLLSGKVLIASTLREKHDEDVKRQVAYLESSGFSDMEGLRKLVAKMVSRNVGRRPGMALVVESLSGFIESLDEPPNLVGFAGGVIPSLVGSLERHVASEHPSFQDVVFLEQRKPSGEATPLTKDEAIKAVEDFLGHSDWEERIPELQRILQRCSAPIEKPFHKILDRAEPKWWKPWEKGVKSKEITSALVILCDYPSEATARRARDLVYSSDAEIATAAKFLLKLVGE